MWWPPWASCSRSGLGCCTCPVHEADIADGYAEVCTDDPNSFECIQRSFAASCKQYKDEHPQEVAAAAAAGLLLIEEDGDTSVVDGGSSAEDAWKRHGAASGLWSGLGRDCKWEAEENWRELQEREWEKN